MTERDDKHQKPFRHELKYLINYGEYHYLRSRLAAIMHLDAYSLGGGYHVRSLYLDDMYFSALDDKLAGVMDREKYRIRIYNLSEKTIKLERKLKVGNMICKESVAITRDEFNEIINKGDITGFNESKGSLRTDFFIAVRTRRLSPAVIVDYMREAYVMAEGNVRITFDKELKSGYNTDRKSVV